MLVLDAPRLMKDVNKLTEVLPDLLDLILKKEYTEAAKRAIDAQKISIIESLSKDIELVLNKVKVTLSWKGVTLEPK